MVVSAKEKKKKKTHHNKRLLKKATTGGAGGGTNTFSYAKRLVGKGRKAEWHPDSQGSQKGRARSTGTPGPTNPTSVQDNQGNLGQSSAPCDTEPKQEIQQNKRLI